MKVQKNTVYWSDQIDAYCKVHSFNFGGDYVFIDICDQFGNILSDEEVRKAVKINSLKLLSSLEKELI
jgi:hypothetical protein